MLCVLSERVCVSVCSLSVCVSFVKVGSEGLSSAVPLLPPLPLRTGGLCRCVHLPPSRPVTTDKAPCGPAGASPTAPPTPAAAATIAAAAGGATAAAAPDGGTPGAPAVAGVVAAAGPDACVASAAPAPWCACGPSVAAAIAAATASAAPAAGSAARPEQRPQPVKGLALCMAWTTLAKLCQCPDCVALYVALARACRLPGCRQPRG
jgi:hypothetical protein